MYRPTVRYDDVYRNYIDQVFRVTSLDRNQIIRLALFTAAHDEKFKEKLMNHKSKDVLTSLPHPSWSLESDRWWLEQSPTEEKGGKDVNDDRLREEKKIRINDGTNGTGTKRAPISTTESRRVGTIRPERVPAGDVIRINFR